MPVKWKQRGGGGNYWRRKRQSIGVYESDGGDHWWYGEAAVAMTETEVKKNERKSVK